MIARSPTLICEPHEFLIEPLMDVGPETLRFRASALNAILRVQQQDQNLDLEPALTQFFDLAGEVVLYDGAYAFFCDQADRELRLRATRDIGSELTGNKLAGVNLLNYWTMKYRRPLLMRLGQQGTVDELLRAVGAACVTVVPLFAGNGPRGVLQLFGADAGCFSRSDAQLLWVLSVASERLFRANAGILSQAAKLGDRDACMQLLGRELERAHQRQRALTLLLMEIDRFGLVREIHGNQTSERILNDVFTALAGNLRGFDAVARSGQEEFTIILPSTATAGALAVAERLKGEFENNSIFADVPTTPVRLTMSIGISVFPADAGSPHALMEAASQALAEAKRAGRNRIVLCSELDDAPAPQPFAFPARPQPVPMPAPQAPAEMAPPSAAEVPAKAPELPVATVAETQPQAAHKSEPAVEQPKALRRPPEISLRTEGEGFLPELIFDEEELPPVGSAEEQVARSFPELQFDPEPVRFSSELRGERPKESKESTTRQARGPLSILPEPTFDSKSVRTSEPKAEPAKQEEAAPAPQRRGPLSILPDFFAKPVRTPAPQAEPVVGSEEPAPAPARATPAPEVAVPASSVPELKFDPEPAKWEAEPKVEQTVITALSPAQRAARAASFSPELNVRPEPVTPEPVKPEPPSFVPAIRMEPTAVIPPPRPRPEPLPGAMPELNVEPEPVRFSHDSRPPAYSVIAEISRELTASPEKDQAEVSSFRPAEAPELQPPVTPVAKIEPHVAPKAAPAPVEVAKAPATASAPTLPQPAAAAAAAADAEIVTQGTRREQRMKIALPVQVWGLDVNGELFEQDAVTVDITTTGAQLMGIRHSLRRGCVIGLKHQTSKARYQVRWVGEPGTPGQGRVGVLLLEEGKLIWGRALRRVLGDDYTGERKKVN